MPSGHELVATSPETASEAKSEPMNLSLGIAVVPAAVPRAIPKPPLATRSSPRGGFPVSLLVRMSILIDRRLNVCVAQLLLSEVDGLAGRQPEGRGGVAQIVEADAGRQASVLQRVVVAAAPNVANLSPNSSSDLLIAAPGDMDPEDHIRLALALVSDDVDQPICVVR